MEEAKTDYVITTRPVVPSYLELPTLGTSYPHVFLRPFHSDDLVSFHELRSQIEVMRWTSTGKIDADLNKTRIWMSRFFDFEHDREHLLDGEALEKLQDANIKSTGFNLAIVYTEIVPESTDTAGWPSGKVIGAAGCHVIDPEPECGYMIRQEYWGRGIATAVLKAILDLYWSFPRKTVRLPASSKDHSPEQVANDGSRGSVDEGEYKVKKLSTAIHVREVLKAEIVATNIGSQRVLEKCGFQYRGSETIEHIGEEIIMAHYDLARP